MNIYLAARYSRREELVGYADDLRRIGHTITARWIDGSHQISEQALTEEDNLALAQRFADEDLVDLEAADLVISFTEQPRASSSRGGRHVEFGLAIARGKTTWIVGPRENVFHVYADKIFSSWLDALRAVEVTEIAAIRATVNAFDARREDLGKEEETK